MFYVVNKATNGIEWPYKNKAAADKYVGKLALERPTEEFIVIPDSDPRALELSAKPEIIKNGTVRHSSRMAELGLVTPVTGYYVYCGMWKGPFDSADHAKEAYREWAWEAKHS